MAQLSAQVQSLAGNPAGVEVVLNKVQTQIRRKQGDDASAWCQLGPSANRRKPFRYFREALASAGDQKWLRRLDKERLFSSIMMQVKEGVVAARSGQGRAGLPRL